MNLHVSVRGAGPDLVLLHGWALHAGVWDGLRDELALRYRVHCVDLPGHGLSPWNPAIETLAHLSAAVAPHIPRDAAVVGWSLGGLVALDVATRAPVRALALISSTPKFVAGPDWPLGMQREVFTQFAARLQVDFKGTVEDFLSLQVRGDLNASATLGQLKARLLEHPPQEPALRTGLKILRDSDLRPLLPELRLPTLVIAGDHDRITSPAAARFMADQLPQARWLAIRRAGHAPFLSHREECLAELGAFLAAEAA